jgi:hypothetical protein
MGWYFRKSKSFGPFRFNLSKSGLGMSFGVKGARVSFGKRGTYVNLGAGGIYYRQKVGGSGRQSSYSNSVEEQTSPTGGDQYFPSEILTDVDSEKFIKELQTKSNRVPLLGPLGLFPLIGAGLVFLAFLVKQIPAQEVFTDVFTVSKRAVHVRATPSTEAASLGIVHERDMFEVSGGDSAGWTRILYMTDTSQTAYLRSDMGAVSRKVKRGVSVRRIEKEPAWMLAGGLYLIAGGAWCVFLARLDKRRRTLEINYTMDGELKSLYESFIRYFDEFTSSNRIWEELTSQEADRRYNAGASSVVTREAIRGVSRHKLPSPELVTNVSIPSITCRAGELYFFPERIIAKRGRTFGGALYKNVDVSISQVRFVEDSTLPSDAEVESHTWQYANKDGSPDRRFTGNRQLPVCRYSQYTITLDTSMSVTITTSKKDAMDNFIGFLRLIGEQQRKVALKA